MRELRQHRPEFCVGDAPWSPGREGAREHRAAERTHGQPPEFRAVAAQPPDGDEALVHADGTGS